METFIHIFQNMQDVVILCCRFAEYGLEMYRDLYHMCTAIVFLIKTLVW